MFIEAPKTSSQESASEYGFNFLEVMPWGGHPIWREELRPLTLRRLSYLFGINEAAGMAILPVPTEHGAPGFPRARRLQMRPAQIETVEEVKGPSIVLGRVLHHGQPAGSAVLPLTAVNRHALVVGSPGSGKTTTVLSLLTHLWQEHQVPFLAIEPVKTEYRTLLNLPAFKDNLHIITLGREDIAPLRLNPLAPPPGVRRETHTNAVMAAFKAALPLFAPLPQLLEESLERCYEAAGWDFDTTSTDDLVPPTLRNLLDSFDTVFEEQGYVGDARNIDAALRVRLSSLLRGNRGRMLDTVESIDFAALMRHPTIIELDAIADSEDKAILSTLLLDRIRAAGRARGSSGGQLRHVTVLEEAHRVLSAAHEQSRGNYEANPRAEGVRAFCEAIAEMRASGEGFILSSQRASELASAAVANCGTRIIHRLESHDDREVVLNDLDASPLDRQAAARLRQGEAVMRWSEQDEAEVLQTLPPPYVDSGATVEDSRVAESMAATTTEVRRLVPYPLCTRDVCTQGCDLQRRSLGQKIAREVGPDARELWAEARRTMDTLDPIASALADKAEGDVELAYCGAVHLAINGDALKIRKRVDIRPQLATAIRKAVEHS